MRHLRPWRMHLQPGTDVVVAVRSLSDHKALMGAVLSIPGLLSGPLYSTTGVSQSKHHGPGPMS